MNFWVRSALATILLSGPGMPGAAAPLPEPDPGRLEADLDYLASPALAGRETGTTGADLAAAHLATQMQDYGLTPIRDGGFGMATPFHWPWTYRAGFGSWARDPGAERAIQPLQGAAVCNVVGVIPGGDPDLRGEYVFITAHFDHLGSHDGTWYPGADDDASGTAGMLEAMRLLRHANPRRSIAFLGVCGEEEGLLGSEQFLADPPVPIGSIKADINLDMIGRGRKGELHIMPAKRDGYVTTLTRQARVCAAAHGATLSAGIEDYWRDSDHYSFARRHIPSVCFNTGLHADYHQPTDTPDKIQFGKLANVVRIVRDLALETANADQAPSVLPTREWQAWAWGPYQMPNLAPVIHALRTAGGAAPGRGALPACVGFSR